MKKAAAFLSYAHVDDIYEDGRVSRLRERLAAEVRLQAGHEFPIFQDRNDVRWGQNWLKRIDGGLDASTFLIPVLTPSFFKSAQCRREVRRFLERERKLRRDDLVLPIYYVGCKELDNDHIRAKDRIASSLSTHQYTDWRQLRFHLPSDPLTRKNVALMAAQIHEAMERKNRGRLRPSAENRPASTTLNASRGNQGFDALLWYGLEDQERVARIATDLKRRGIQVWLEREQMRPGLLAGSALIEGVRRSKSVAIFLGQSLEWKQPVFGSLLKCAIRQKRLLIPVILPGFRASGLPLVLERTTPVDFRIRRPSPMDLLLWGITGERP